MKQRATRLIIERDVPMTMRDGVRLAADVYRADGDGQWPTLVHRLPYGKDSRSAVMNCLFDPVEAVERGYAVVVQDVRGCGSSEGTFGSVPQERADGHDTIQWATSQPWSNGSIGIYGSSYMGVTALQATVDAPASLKATLAYITAARYHETWGYVGGAFELAFNIRWTFERVGSRLGRGLYDAATEAAARQALARFAADPFAFYEASFDVRDLVREVLPMAPYLGSFLEHEPSDEYWSAMDVVGAAERIAVPVMNIAGWYDAFSRSQLDLHRALVERGPTELHDSHRLIVGPWDHRAYTSSLTLSTAGNRSFGSHAAGGRPGLKDVALSWFDTWLRPDEDVKPTSTVRYFNMGPDVWEESDTWPPIGRKVRWYLASGGKANTRAGDGVLAHGPGVGAAADTYSYDPRRPAPTTGGRTLIYEVPSGPQDQGDLQDRDDVLVYTSPRLVEAFTIRGPVELELFVRTSAATTDIVAVLADVDSHGHALNVVEGIVRLPVIETRPPPVRTVLLDLWDTSYTFPAGHRLRLHITGSSFPRFDRNPNTIRRDGSIAVAVQEVLHDAAHPSALVVCGGE